MLASATTLYLRRKLPSVMLGSGMLSDKASRRGPRDGARLRRSYPIGDIDTRLSGVGWVAPGHP
jgi:hypothetical protein